MLRRHAATLAVFSSISLASVTAAPDDSRKRAPELEQFQKKGFHTLWLRVDCMDIDPATQQESPDVLRKQAIREMVLSKLRAAGLVVHFDIGAHEDFPLLTVFSAYDLKNKQTKFNIVLSDQFNDSLHKNETHERQIWKRSEVKTASGKSYIQPFLGTMTDEFVLKFRPYIRDKQRPDSPHEKVESV
jgi:hypothetical protein